MSALGGSATQHGLAHALVHDVWIVALVILAALLVELAYRVYLFGVDGLNFVKLDSVQPLGRSGLLRRSDCPELVFELVPNQDAWFKLVRIRTNAEGQADRAYPRSKPDGVFRIAVLGSSYSMAAGVESEDAWPKVLERRLNARDPGRFEVINFSVGGYDPRQLLASLKHRAVDYDPDLILVDVTLNSPRVIRREEVYTTPYEPQRRGHPALRSFVLDALLPSSQGRDSLFFLPEDQSRAQFRRILGQFRDVARTLQRPLCVVLLQHDPKRAKATAALREEVGRAGVSVIDTFPAFANERFSDLVILKDDIHPNARAQGMFAECIFNALVQRNLIDRAP